MEQQQQSPTWLLRRGKHSCRSAQGDIRAVGQKWQSWLSYESCGADMRAVGDVWVSWGSCESCGANWELWVRCDSLGGDMRAAEEMLWSYTAFSSIGEEIWHGALQCWGQLPANIGIQVIYITCSWQVFMFPILQSPPDVAQIFWTCQLHTAWQLLHDYGGSEQPAVSWGWIIGKWQQRTFVSPSQSF